MLAFAKVYEQSRSRIPLLFCFLALTLLAGLRDVNVGTDSWNYYIQFHDKELWGRFNLIEGIFSEGLFDLLVVLSQRLSNNYCSLFIIVSAIVYGISLGAIRRISMSYVISIFVYITLGIAVFCYNGERQAIAIAIYMLSFPYIEKQNFKKYCMIVLFAALFHRTIIVAIPLYYIFKLKFSTKTILLVIFSSSFLVLLLPTLLQYATQIDQKYTGYMALSSGGGEYLTLAYVVMTIFFIFARKYIEEQKRATYDIYLLMFISGTIVYVIVLLASLYIEISRFACYFHVSALFIWPMIMKSKLGQQNVVVKLAFIIGHLFFMYIYYSRMSGLVPYMFNTTL